MTRKKKIIKEKKKNPSDEDLNFQFILNMFQRHLENVLFCEGNPFTKSNVNKKYKNIFGSETERKFGKRIVEEVLFLTKLRCIAFGLGGSDEKAVLSAKIKYSGSLVRFLKEGAFSDPLVTDTLIICRKIVNDYSTPLKTKKLFKKIIDNVYEGLKVDMKFSGQFIRKPPRYNELIERHEKVKKMLLKVKAPRQKLIEPHKKEFRSLVNELKNEFPDLSTIQIEDAIAGAGPVEAADRLIALDEGVSYKTIQERRTKAKKNSPKALPK